MQSPRISSDFTEFRWCSDFYQSSNEEDIGLLSFLKLRQPLLRAFFGFCDLRGGQAAVKITFEFLIYGIIFYDVSLLAITQRHTQPFISFHIISLHTIPHMIAIGKFSPCKAIPRVS